MSSLVIKSDENSPNSTEISTLLPLENIKKVSLLLCPTQSTPTPP